MADNQFSRAELESLRVPDLRKILRSLGQPVSGIKLDLIDRIIEAQCELKTKSVILELEISKLEISTRELEISRFHRDQVNHDSSSVNPGQHQNVPLSRAVDNNAGLVSFFDDNRPHVQQGEKAVNRQRQHVPRPTGLFGPGIIS